jgi:hypothetical protein
VYVLAATPAGGSVAEQRGAMVGGALCSLRCARLTATACPHFSTRGLVEIHTMPKAGRRVALSSADFDVDEVYDVTGLVPLVVLGAAGNMLTADPCPSPTALIARHGLLGPAGLPRNRHTAARQAEDADDIRGHRGLGETENPAMPEITSAPAETMTVTIRDRSAEAPWGVGPTSPVVRTLTISASCPTCSARRGQPSTLRQHDDGCTYYVDVWTNPCGHLDRYEAVVDEARSIGHAR